MDERRTHVLAELLADLWLVAPDPPQHPRCTARSDFRDWTVTDNRKGVRLKLGQPLSSRLLIVGNTLDLLSPRTSGTILEGDRFAAFLVAVVARITADSRDLMKLSGLGSGV